MDNPNLYRVSNGVQAQITKDVLQNLWKNILWNSDEDNYILDIGCGTGEVTCEILFPMLPSFVEIVLAVDINKKMIASASKRYCNNPKIKFEVLDIGKEVPNDLEEKFHHVFSFFCLQWIKNQSLVMKNIYKLLKPGGNALFTLIASSDQVYQSYSKMKKEKRWGKYMADLEDVLSPYRNEDKPEELLKTHLKNAGLEVLFCENMNKSLLFSEEKILTDFLESVNPFVKKMVDSEKEEFMKLFIEMVKQGDPREAKNGTTILYANVLVACVRKSV